MRKFTFNPTTATSGSINVQLPAGNMKVKFMNHSPANLTLSFPNGDTAALVSLTQREFSLDLNSAVINWSVDSYAGSVTQGLSLVVVETYEHREDFVRVSGLPAAAPPNLTFFTSQVGGAGNNTITFTSKPGVLFYLTQFEYYSTDGEVNDISINVVNGAVLSGTPATAPEWIIGATKTGTPFHYTMPTPYVQKTAGTSMFLQAAGGSAGLHILSAWGYYI